VSQTPQAAGALAHPEDRRHTADRRKPQSVFARHVWFGGRRRTVRRDWEREGAIVDLHGPRLLVMAVAIVALNLLDAWFTLLFLSHGGQEMNPMVQVILDLGHHPWPFLIFKTIGIGLAVTLLVLAKNFRPARIGLWIVLVGYTVLLGWHLFLYAQLDSVR